MDPVRSAEKSRSRSRRIPQDFRLYDSKSNFESQEGKFSPSHLGSVKNSPESEANPKHWAIVSEGFPPGVTVDELKKYGRRRQLSHLRPQDNLRLEEGSLRLYKSEYKRRFLAYNLPKVPVPSEEEKVLENDDPCACCSLRGPSLRPRNNLFVLKDQPMEDTTEKNSKYVPFLNYEKRKLLRRSTALRPEGEIARETEARKEYVDHKNPEKVRLIRNLPSLRLEGEYEPLTTEQRDKFIAYLLSRRPVLEKKKTSLKMEGEFDFATEKTRSYVPHELSERPLLRKRSTSLKLEGEVDFSPEYRMSFVDFPRSRPVTYKPLEFLQKLRHEGELENLTETKTQFVNYENVQIPGSAKPENNLHVEGEMEINPEYRINFVDFPRERPIIRKPFNQLKPEGNLEVLRESSGKGSGAGGQDDNVQREKDLRTEKELSYLSENTREVKEDEIPDEVENGEGKARADEEIKLGTERNERSGGDAGRTRSGKLEREFIFFPEFKRRHMKNEGPVNTKFTKEVKSNSSSPRKKGQRDKLKTPFEDQKKSSSESLRGKSSVKRLKEAASVKSQTEILREQPGKLEEGRRRDGHPQSLRFLNVPPNGALPALKEYPAFRVLDVKGQMGCQSLARDIMESEKSTSDEESSTYRLEVFNSGNRSPGFFKNDRRIFPSLPLDHVKLEEAEARVKQRAENYVKVVKSPEIPKCLLEECERETENRWRVSEKLCPLSPGEDLNERSFVVLEKKGEEGLEPVRMPREICGKEKEGWMMGARDSSTP